MRMQVKPGIDGKTYVVFPDATERHRFQSKFPQYASMPVACFGQSENAFELKDDSNV